MPKVSGLAAHAAIIAAASGKVMPAGDPNYNANMAAADAAEDKADAARMTPKAAAAAELSEMKRGES